MPIQPAEVIGPIPDGQDPDEYDKTRRRVLWAMPYGLYVLGSRAGDRRNAMTVSFASQVATTPKLVGVGVLKEALTHELIVEGGIFTLNFIDREDKAIVRKFVKPVEVDLSAGTLNGFAYHDSRSGAPVLDQAVAYVDCSVRQAIDCGDHTWFIGEVVDAGFQKDEATPVLRMEDTRMSYGG